MSGPDAAEPRGEPRGRAILHAFLQNGRGRSPVLLGIFLLVLFAAGRAAPGAAPGAAPSVLLDPASSGTPRLAEPRVSPASTESSPPLPEPTPEALAMDNLLARYDALIRLLEIRSIDGPAAAADPALAELRALRGRTYAAARRAVIARAPARDP